MNAYYIGRLGESLAAGSIGKPFGKFRQDLQVLFGCLLGHQQDKKQGDRLAIRRIEWNWRRQADKRAACFFQSLDASVGNGNTPPEPCRPKFLPRKKAVEDGTARDALVVFENKPGMLENAFLAAHLKIENNVFLRQQVRYLAHKDAVNESGE